MKKRIEIGPKSINLEDGKIVANYTNRSVVFAPCKALKDDNEVNLCASHFVCCLYTMKYVESMEEVMSRNGFEGRIIIYE